MVVEEQDITNSRPPSITVREKAKVKIEMLLQVFLGEIFRFNL